MPDASSTASIAAREPATIVESQSISLTITHQPVGRDRVEHPRVRLEADRHGDVHVARVRGDALGEPGSARDIRLPVHQ